MKHYQLQFDDGMWLLTAHDGNGLVIFSGRESLSLLPCDSIELLKAGFEAVHSLLWVDGVIVGFTAITPSGHHFSRLAEPVIYLTQDMVIH